MTFAELKAEHPNERIVAMADSDNGINLYAGTDPLPWPSDWPTSGIKGGWIEDQGVEILR